MPVNLFLPSRQGGAVVLWSEIHAPKAKGHGMTPTAKVIHNKRHFDMVLLFALKLHT